MANVIGSFQQGVNAGKSLIDISNNREDRARNKVLQQRQDVRYQQGLDDRKLQLAEHKEDRDRSKVIQGRQDTRWQQGLEDRTQTQKEHKEDRGRKKVVQGREDKLFEEKQTAYNHKLVLQKRQEGYKTIYLPALDKAIATGDFSLMKTPEFKEYIKENPGLDVAHILSDDTGDALSHSASLLKNASNGQLPSDNDPELLQSVTALFPEITKASTLPQTYTAPTGEKSKILKRNISGVHLMPDGSFTIQQELTLDNGKKVKVPVTANRTSAPDDKVLQIPMSDFTSRMHQYSDGRTKLSQTELNNWRYLQTGRGLGFGKKSTKGGAYGSRTTGSKTTTSIVKQQLSEADAINKFYDNKVSDAQSMGGDDVESKVSGINKERSVALQRNTDMYASLTNYDPQATGKQKSITLARNKTNSIISQYPKYNFDISDQTDIQNYLLNNPSADPKDIDSAIQLMIKNGQVTKVGASDSSKSADDIVKKIKSDSGSPTPEQGQPQDQLPDSNDDSKMDHLREYLVNGDDTYQKKADAINNSDLTSEQKAQANEWLQYSGLYHFKDSATSGLRDSQSNIQHEADEQRKNASLADRARAQSYAQNN